MSPNMLVVTTTSNSCGERTRWAVAASTMSSRSSTSGWRKATARTSSRKSPSDSLRTFALWTAVTRPRRPAARRKASSATALQARRDDLAHREREVRVGHELAAAGHHVAVAVEALGVLTDDDEVEGLGQHGEVGDAACRADVRVQPVGRPDRGRRVPATLGARRVVEVRDRAEDGAVDLADAVEHGLRHRLADGLVRSPADVGVLDLEVEPEGQSSAARSTRSVAVADLGPDRVAWEHEEPHDDTPLPLSPSRWAMTSSVMVLTWLPGTTVRATASRHCAKWGAARCASSAASSR